MSHANVSASPVPVEVQVRSILRRPRETLLVGRLR